MGHSDHIAVVSFTIPSNNRWHPNEKFGVAEDGSLLKWSGDKWITSCYDDGDAGIYRHALKAALEVSGRKAITQSQKEG